MNLIKIKFKTRITGVNSFRYNIRVDQRKSNTLSINLKVLALSTCKGYGLTSQRSLSL